MVWFLISEKNYPRVHACTKSLKQGKHKNCIPKFPILSTHELLSRGLVVFKDMNTFMYRGLEFQNILERISCSYFGLWTVVTYLLENIENGIEHGGDNAYGVCLH